MTSEYKAGQKTKYSGTYQCDSCGKSKTIGKGKKIVGCKCGGSNWTLRSYTTKIPEKDKNFLERIFG